MTEITPTYNKLRNKQPESNPLFSDFGKLPPQAIDIEECVLGALMLQSDSILKINDLITPEIFYKDEHKEIYSVIIDLFSQSKPVDIISITNELKKRNKLDEVGGSYRLSELTNHVANSNNIEWHCRLLVEKYLFRELIKFSSTLQEKAFADESDIFDLMDFAMQQVYEISNFIKTGETKIAAELIAQIYNEINNPSEVLTIPSRFEWISEISGGYYPGCVYIFASRPGHGKSVIAMNEAIEISRTYPVLYDSLEMTATELIKRGLSDLSGIHNFRIQRNNIHPDEVEIFDKAAGKIEKLNLFINDKARQGIDDIYLNAKKYKLQKGVKLLIIDHFHLLKLTKKTESESYNYNIQRCKEIAKELNLPVIVLFQLNRDHEKEPKRKPRNTDLREVGEQDADFIMFLRRPELYGLTEFDEMSTDGMMLWDVTKNRQGKTKGKRMKFLADFQRIEAEEYEVKNNYQEDNPF